MTPEEQVESVRWTVGRGGCPGNAGREHGLERDLVRSETRQVARSLVVRAWVPSMIGVPCSMPLFSPSVPGGVSWDCILGESPQF